LKRFKKILKISGLTLGVLLIGGGIAIHILLEPKSDAKVLRKVSNAFSQAELSFISYKQHKIRRIQMQEHPDSTKLSLVFVHGSPGSLLDFRAYLTDSLLLSTYNMYSYDRVGYGTEQPGVILGTLSDEIGVLSAVTADLPIDKTIVIGYSFGGPVVLASPIDYRQKVTFAPAVAADLEPQFWVQQLCHWKATRWMIPDILCAAADEKAAHQIDLPKYHDKWKVGGAPIINVQGRDDWIVPYENSERLASALGPNKLRQIDFDDAGHELIWSKFEAIKKILLNLNEDYDAI